MTLFAVIPKTKPLLSQYLLQFPENLDPSELKKLKNKMKKAKKKAEQEKQSQQQAQAK